MFKLKFLFAIFWIIGGLTLGQDDPQAKKADHVVVFKQITEALNSLAVGLEGIQSPESAAKAQKSLSSIMIQIDELQKRRRGMEAPPKEGSVAADLSSQVVAHRILEKRIRKEVLRLQENARLAEFLADLLKELKVRFPKTEENRSPFEPQGTLLERTLGRQDGMGRRSSAYRNFMPKITLQGWVEDAKGQKIALIKVNDAGVYMVREKEKITVTTAQTYSEIQIEKISRTGVVLKTGMPPVTQVIR